MIHFYQSCVLINLSLQNLWFQIFLEYTVFETQIVHKSSLKKKPQICFHSTVYQNLRVDEAAAWTHFLEEFREPC